MEDSGQGHGSCVASKAAGRCNGVSKASKLVILKTPFDLRGIAWSFDKVCGLIERRHKSQKRSVVVFPASAGTNDFREQNRYPWNWVKPIIQELFKIDAIVVVPSGNYRSNWLRRNVDTVPGIWASPNFPLIVIGAVDNDGNQANFAQGGDRVTTWAPGVQVRCAGADAASGTSFAAPMVSDISIDLYRVRENGLGNKD